MGTFDRAYGAQARQNRRDQLLKANLPLVKHVVGRVAMELPDGLATDPLEAGGLYGLLDAISKFDPGKEAEFPAEARERIEQGIHDALKREWNLSAEAAERLLRVRNAYAQQPPPVDLAGLAQASSLPAEELIDSLISLRLAERLSPAFATEAMPFELAERRAAEWAKGQVEPRLLPLFASLETVPSRLLTLYFREDLRLQEISEILRLPQVETKRIYRRALWGIGESLRQTS